MRLLAGLVLIGILALSASLTWGAPFAGPFDLEEGLTFYVLNPTGNSFDVAVRRTHSSRTSYPEPGMLRVFDPQGDLVYRHIFPGEKVAAPPIPWDETACTVPAGEPGIYRIIVHGGGQADLKLTPALQFGVFGTLQYLRGRGDQFSDTYVYLPPGLDKLPVTASYYPLESLTLTDDQGQVRLRMDKNRDTWDATVDLPPGQDRIWRLSLRGSSYRVDFHGLPIILCPSEEVARALHAGTEVMPDGTLCFFPHQVKAWQLLQRYKRLPAGEYAVAVKPLQDYQAEYLKEPARNQLLFTLYGVMHVLPPILAQQNLDPASPWFGSIWTWKDEQGNPRAGNPLADYNRQGLESLGALNSPLAALYWMNEPFNPYYHDAHLLNRIIVAALLDQLMMRPGEYVMASNTNYYGSHGFPFNHAHSGAFSLVYPSVPADVQAVWRAGQQRLTDRFLLSEVATNNQWAIMLVALWRYYEGTREENYKQEILNSAHYLTRGQKWGSQRPAGYMTEAMGPDATYNGITAHEFAFLYHQSQDPELLDSLRRCYYLFNHTVAPEPNGSWLGSSGFCHRTPGDWTSPQYGAGLVTMANILPEAGVRFPNNPPWAAAVPPTTAALRTAAEAELLRVLNYAPEDCFSRDKANYGRALGAFNIYFHNWLNFPPAWTPGRLPAQEEASFTRNFGNEFLCVKRPGYYAFLFAARDYEPWQKAGTLPQTYNEQVAHNDGLCLFWSPEFGASLLSKNWSAMAANTLLADLGDGRIGWPDYWETRSQLDADAATAVLTGKLQYTPLAYQRRYQFLEDRVECEVAVQAAEALTLRGLSECVPYPIPSGKPGGLTVKLYDARAVEVPSGKPARAIFFTNDSGQGHLLVLEQPAVVTLGINNSKDHYGNAHDWGRALISLPATFAAGQVRGIRYTLRPCSAADLPEVMAGWPGLAE